jgi:hypothetical protein
MSLAESNDLRVAFAGACFQLAHSAIIPPWAASCLMHKHALAVVEPVVPSRTDTAAGKTASWCKVSADAS